jgi:glycine oxidase
MPHPFTTSDVCIAGGGIIGLSLALELDRRGASVVVVERDIALSHASTAAAGMLAAHDPENPFLLQPLSELSVALYPSFLQTVEALSGMPVPFQTATTLQAHSSYANDLDATVLPQLRRGAHRFAVLEEHSVDPRQLAGALLAAVRSSSVQLLEHMPLRIVSEGDEEIRIDIGSGELLCRQLVHTQGPWSFAPVTPRKGQMLSVALPDSLGLASVIRTPEVYIVPRFFGPRARRAVIGATVEDAGFDTTTYPADLAALRAQAAELLPGLADEVACVTVDHWAGLRPATPDALPLLGLLPGSLNQFVATGHYRNGILLAPATAQVMAQVLSGKTPGVDLTRFSASRFPRLT